MMYSEILDFHNIEQSPVDAHPALDAPAPAAPSAP